MDEIVRNGSQRSIDVVFSSKLGNKGLGNGREGSAGEMMARGVFEYDLPINE